MAKHTIDNKHIFKSDEIGVGISHSDTRKHILSSLVMRVKVRIPSVFLVLKTLWKIILYRFNYVFYAHTVPNYQVIFQLRTHTHALFSAVAV